MSTDAQVQKVIEELNSKGMEKEATVVEELLQDRVARRQRMLSLMDARDFFRKQYEVLTGREPSRDV